MAINKAFSTENVKSSISSTDEPALMLEEKATLEAMSRELSQMIVKMNNLSAQCLMLNVDIVSQFDPAVIQELSSIVEECKACTGRINNRLEEARSSLESKTNSSSHEDTKSIET